MFYFEKGAKFEGDKSENSFQVGKMLGEKAKAAKIKAVCVDRNGYKYHGRVKAVVDALEKPVWHYKEIF